MSKMSQLYGDVSEMLEQGMRFEAIASELIQSYGLNVASAAQFIREVEQVQGLDSCDEEDYDQTEDWEAAAKDFEDSLEEIDPIV